MNRPAVIAAFAVALAACRPPTPAEPDASRPPARVVTLAPSLTSIVLALGAGDRLVGVTRFDDAPEVAQVTRVGGFNDPSVETLLSLRPDLVLAQPSPGNRGAVDALRKQGVPVTIIPPERSFADIVTNIRALGTRLQADDRARALVESLSAAAARARRRAAARGHRPAVVLVYGLAPLVVAGPGSFPHDLLTIAGATTVVASSAQEYPHVPPTALLATNPPLDALLLAGLDQHGTAGDGLPDTLATRARPLRSKGFLQPGPLVAEALDELTDVLDALAAGPRP